MVVQRLNRAARSIAIAAAAVVLFPTQATAQGQSSFAVYVFGSTFSNEQFKECGLTYSPAVSVIEAALKEAGVKLATEDEYYANEAISAWVKIGAVSIDDNDSRSGWCAARVGIEFSTNMPVPLPANLGLGSTRRAKVVFCDTDMVFAGPSYDLQNRLHMRLPMMVDLCVSRIAKE